ncbi:Thioredoxin domain-containing protein 2, partial [Rhizoclosmatium sp. JEL0117]
MGGSVIEITSESEFNTYINSPTLTIVDFTATWCGPCKMVAPRYESLASKYPSVPFLKVDVDQHRDISGTWGVRAMPTFMFFQAGQKVDEVVGADIGKVESLVYMKAPKGGSFPATGGRTLGGGSGSGEAGGSYVNPWKDEKPVVGSGGVVKQDVVGKKETGVMVSQSDKNVLVEMGFAESRVVAALKATGNAGLQPAMDWLFANPDESFMDVEESSGTAKAEGSAGVASNETGAAEGNDDAITEAEATAASLKCDDCGRLLRDAAAAEFHAVKSGHQNFSESTQVIKPLTEEEKKAKLEQLKIKMAQKKEEKRLAEIEESKAKEKVRRTTGKEMVEMKEKMAELELKKAAEQKKREKEEDRIAKAKIKAQIELDRKDRAAR